MNVERYVYLLYDRDALDINIKKIKIYKKLVKEANALFSALIAKLGNKPGIKLKRSRTQRMKHNFFIIQNAIMIPGGEVLILMMREI